MEEVKVPLASVIAVNASLINIIVFISHKEDKLEVIMAITMVPQDKAQYKSNNYTVLRS